MSEISIILGLQLGTFWGEDQHYACCLTLRTPWAGHPCLDFGDTEHAASKAECVCVKDPRAFLCRASCSLHPGGRIKRHLNNSLYVGLARVVCSGLLKQSRTVCKDSPEGPSPLFFCKMRALLLEGLVPGLGGGADPTPLQGAEASGMNYF